MSLEGNQNLMRKKSLLSLLDNLQCVVGAGENFTDAGAEEFEGFHLSPIAGLSSSSVNSHLSPPFFSFDKS